MIAGLTGLGLDWSPLRRRRNSEADGGKLCPASVSDIPSLNLGPIPISYQRSDTRSALGVIPRDGIAMNLKSLRRSTSACQFDWFLTLYPSYDIRINYGQPAAGQTGRLFLPFDAMVGRMLTDNLIISFEVGVPLIRDYPVYNFKAELRLAYEF